MKETIAKIVDYNDSKGSKLFNGFIQLLVIISMITFAIETIPHLSKTTKNFLNFINIFLTIIFTIEYIARIYISENKLKYIFSFYGIVDLLSILPFYISSNLDTQFVKILRLFRLVRLLKLFRYSDSLNRFSLALKESKEEFIIFILLTFFLFYVSAVGIYFFEHQVQPEHFSSVFASMWWAVATLTTVGYGDVYPVTTGGKIFTTLILIIGLGIVSVPAGIISSALLSVRNKEQNNKEQELLEEIKSLKEEIKSLKK